MLISCAKFPDYVHVFSDFWFQNSPVFQSYSITGPVISQSPPARLMNLTLTDESSLRILSRAVQVASKLTDHVQFTPHAQSIHLRLLTAAHSTYALFRFSESFFSTLELSPNAPSYKVSSRLLFPLLRSPQNVSTLRIHTQGNILRLTIVTTSGLTKRFRIPRIEGRIASIRPTPTPYLLCASAVFLSTLLSNFHAKLEEITLIPSPDSVKLVSFVDDVSDPSNAFLRTEITVDSSQFDQHAYSGSPQSEFTFLCRPLRAVVEFCAAMDVPITLRYDKPGTPLNLELAVMSPAGEPHFDASFVFSSRVVPVIGTRIVEAPQPQPVSPSSPSPPRSRRAIRPLNLQTDTDALTSAQTPAAREAFLDAQPSPSDEVPPTEETPASEENDSFVPGTIPEGEDDDDFVEGTPPP